MQSIANYLALCLFFIFQLTFQWHFENAAAVKLSFAFADQFIHSLFPLK